MKKNKKTYSEIKEAESLLTDDQKAMMDDVAVADFVYDSVIDQLNIKDGDVLQRSIVYGMLVRQTKDQIILSIWNNLTEKQANHLRDFVNQATTLIPGIPHENLMMEFARLYPDLMDEVYESLSGFFKDFIEKFNEINGA